MSNLMLKFRWSGLQGEGLMNKADSKRLLEEDWLIAADFLSDVIRDAQNLYTAVLDKRGNG